MGEVYIFDKNGEDFSTTGLCGALTPFSCEHEEIAGGMSAVTLEHPFDGWGCWKYLERGNILKCLCRVRTTPEIQGDQVVTEIEEWSVKATATQQQRGVYSKAAKGRRKATLKPGTQVIVVQKGETRYKIRSGKVSGWVAHEALDFVLKPEPLPQGADGIEQSAPPWIVRYQLFRIQEVDVDTYGGTVTAYAPHISYDLSYNNTYYENMEPLTAAQALGGILGGCDFEHEFEARTDIGDSRTSAEWANVSPISALLDPENGFCARWGAELVRDDFELYFLRRAGRNRGARIEYAKNLLGVTMQVSDEQVATAILPLGEKKDGSTLYLTDSPPGQTEGEPGLAVIEKVVEIESESGETISAITRGNYVISPRAGDYPFRRVYVLNCQDCTVEKGKKGVTLEIARARMLEQAQKLFDEDEIDLPSVNMTVNFVQLGDTLEYAQYKGLEPVYLYDEVAVIDKRHGIEVFTDVHRVKWDCLLERMIEIELGNVREGGGDIYSWQIVSMDGGKLKPGTVPGGSLEDGTVPEGKLDPDLQAALNKAKEDIASAKEMLDDARTRLATAEAAVRDSEGNISLLQQDAKEIWTGLTNAKYDLAAVSLRADQLQTALTNAQGDVSTLIQRADSMSSTVSALSGEISSVRQTANSISSTVATLDGRVQSLIDQTAQGVAIKLQNTINGTLFEASFGTENIYDSNKTGLTLKKNDASCGGLYASGSNLHVGAPNGYLEISGGTGEHDTYIAIGSALGNGPNMAIQGNIIPYLNKTYNLGSSVSRWNTIYGTASVNTSDRRAKRDIAPLMAGELLRNLIPVRYRLKDTPAKLRFGFIAQDVAEAIQGAGFNKCALLHDEDLDHLGLVYSELIAVLVEGWQSHEAQIAALTERVARLEENHAET